MENKNKLALKLLKILETMDSVPKNGYNSHQKYHYMREVDVMEALKKELINNKIVMLTSSKFVDIQKKVKEKSGGDKNDEFVTTVETTHTFVDAETGEQHTITSVGSGYDSSDKGASKAITAAFKYAIMKTFMISDEGADIENDGKTEQKPVKTAPKIGAASIKVAETSSAAAKIEPKGQAVTNTVPVAAPVVTPPVPEVKAEAPKKVEAPVKTTQINFAKRTTTPAPQAVRKQEPGF